jgi:hypothetical protein
MIMLPNENGNGGTRCIRGRIAANLISGGLQINIAWLAFSDRERDHIPHVGGGDAHLCPFFNFGRSFEISVPLWHVREKGNAVHRPSKKRDWPPHSFRFAFYGSRLVPLRVAIGRWLRTIGSDAGCEGRDARLWRPLSRPVKCRNMFLAQ